MRSVSHFCAPVLVAFLSLGFVGHSPFEPVSRRHVASTCSDLEAQTSSSAVSVPAFPTNLFPFIRDANVRQTAESYSLFLRSMEINSYLYSLTAPSRTGYQVPLFPSYTLPLVSNYSIDTRRPDPSNQIFGGLMSNPALQYLKNPTNEGTTNNRFFNTTVAGATDLPPIATDGTLTITSGNNIGISSSKF